MGYHLVYADFPIEYEKKRVLAEFINLAVKLEARIMELKDKLSGYTSSVKNRDERLRELYREASIDKLLEISKIVSQINAMYRDFEEAVKSILSVSAI